MGYKLRTRDGSRSRLRTPVSMLLLGVVLLSAHFQLVDKAVEKLAKEHEKATEELTREHALAVEKAREEAATAAAAIAAATTANAKPDAEVCRSVFSAIGQGGLGTFNKAKISGMCRNPNLDGACEELQDFTGLSDEEFQTRLRRLGRFHFEGEHLFWNPQSKTELAWFYATSIDYLFANVIHAPPVAAVAMIGKEHEPVLEYSGGTGNNVIYLAERGVRVHYFGIGMAERAFARYRVERRGLEDLVEFKTPFSAKTNYTFDPINGPLPRDGSLGSVMAMDVLEHIPNYHVVVEAMVDSIRVGGLIIESSPFGRPQNGQKEDLRVHVSNGGIPMEQAMGPRMKRKSKPVGISVWEKISE